MTEPYDKPADHAERVNDVLARAVALSDELQDTIGELTQILRTEGEVEVSDEHSAN